MADETTPQTQFQQRADMNLRLFDGNAEQWTIAHDKLREARSKGIPLQLEDILESDNNLIFGLTSAGLNPRLQQVLAEHPDRVATYRDQLPRLNAFANASDWASKTPEERTLEIQKLYHRKGIPLEKRKQYGYLRSNSGGTFSDASGRRVNPVSYLDACGASEREVITRAIETIRKQTGFDAGKLEGYDKLSDDGKKFVVGTALSHFKKVNALMAALQHEVGSNWRDMSDANLRKQIDALSVNLNADFSDIDTAALRKGDVTDVDYMEMLNVFGWRDIAKVGASAFGFTRSSEELAKIDANSPLEDQLALLEHLKQQSLGMRGLDFWGDVANAVAVSTPYMLEFMLTGGAATVGKLSARAAVRQALKAGGVEGVRGIATAMFRKEGRAALGKAAGAILTAEAKRAPFLLPKNIAQAIEEADSGPVYLPGEDGLKTVVPQAKVDQVVTLALRNVLRDYISRTTEWSGELLPDVNLLSRMIPKKYKNKLASLILRDVTASADPTKVGIVTRALLDDLPLSGDVTEFLEEKIDQAAQYGATKLSEIVGVKALDMEQDTLVGSWQDNLKAFVSVAVSTNAFRAVRLAGKVGTVRDIARIVDDHRAMADAASNIPLESRSVVQSREFYDYVRGGDRMFYLDADDAMTFLQSDPEFAASCGITEETVNASDRDGVFVQVSENTLLAERAKSPAANEAGERLLSLARQAGIPVGDALTVDVGEEVVQEYKAQQERINRFRNKFQAAFAAAEAAGVSRTAIQKNAELVSRVLNMFADNLDSDERIEKALDGLLTQMVEDPENFSGSYRPAYLSEETEEIVRSLESIAPPAETTEAVETKRDPLEELDDETVRKYMPFIDKAVNFFKQKYSSLTLDEGELVTIAWSAFARAKQSFNPESGAKFSTYASKAIGNAIQKYTKKVSNRGETSLNTSLDEDGTERQDFITDTSAGADEALASAEDASKAAAVAREWVKSLTPNQRRILRMVFSGTNTQAEIAEKLAVSKQSVSKTIARITEAVAKSGIPGPELMASLKELAENDDKLFEQRDLLLQEEGIIRGATQFGDYFDSNYRAIITLFKGNANASTLVHESAHWLKGLMKALCDLKDSDGNFIADDTLREEYASIEKWLDAQTYKSAAGTKEYTIEREEKFARAFEYYIMNGKAPSAGVASAFDTLKRYLCRIYQSIVNGFEKEFGFVLSDDIRGVFDRMLSTQNTLDRESPLREAAGILRETFSGLLGLSQDETRDIQKLIKLADTQMATEIDRHKTKLLPEFRRIWKKEAEGARNELRVYRAIADAAKGKDADGRLDTKVLAADGVNEKDIDALRARGLAVRNGANPADLVSKHQYSSIQELVQDILSNPTPKEFVDNYMKEQEEQLFRDMELDEKTLSVSAIRQVLDTLSGLLAVKGGKEGYVIRKGEAENAALKTLGEMQVSDVINDRTHIRSLKEHASILTNAISKQDYLTALDRIDQIRKLVAVLKEKGDAKKRVSVIQDKLRKAVKAKKGTIYGDYHDALKELAYYFGFTRRKPEQPGENFRKKVMEHELSDDLSDGFMWESFLLSDRETRYKDLKYADFEVLANLAEHLYGTGKDLVAEAKGSFGARAQKRRDAIVASLSKLPARYDRRRDSSRAASLGRSLLHVGENLRVLLGRADGYVHVGTGESGPCLALRDILVPAVSEAVALESETLSQVKVHLDALWASRDRISLPPPHFRFTGRGLTYGYSKWTPEMVIAACLNLGNEVNRDRLVRGYGWEYLDLNDIASCVPADLWQHIQGIWNAIGGKLQEKSAETFFKENHYRMRLVVPDGMGVQYLNGKSISFEGGYYPIRYAHRAKSKSTVVPSHTQGLYAQVSSTMLRSERIDNPEPLELSLSGLLKHIHETSFYAATRLACRDVLAVFRSPEVEDAFGSTQSFEAYNMAHNLLRNIANPDALTEGTGGDGGFMDTFEKWSKTAMTAGALMGNISSVLKQPASLTVGANETGTFFLDAIAAYSQNPVALTDKVKQLSAMMRDRINYMDPDLKSAATRFGKSGVERTRETMSRIGYAAMRFMDGAVAVPVWYSKYMQVESRLTAEGKLSSADIVKQAAAEADDFIARTQGAGRTLDLTPIQLDRIGRLISPFITAASAQYNTAIENLGAIRAGRMTSGEALMAITLNILAPAVYSSLVIAVLNGALSDDDDDIDRAMKAALTELLSSPFSGFPLVRDVGQYVAGAAVDRALGGKKSYRPELFDVSSFEAVNRVFKGLSESAESTLEGDFGRAAWKATDAFGSAAGVPAIRIYERTMRQYKRSGGELPELLSKLEEVTKQKRKGAER